MSKSLLVFLKYKDEKQELKSILGDGKILWFGKNGFEIIGEGKEEWDTFGLVRYPSRKTFQKMFTLRSKTESNEAIHRDAGLDKTKVIALYPKKQKNWNNF